jgi:hypothetical protein
MGNTGRCAGDHASAVTERRMGRLKRMLSGVRFVFRVAALFVLVLGCSGLPQEPPQPKTSRWLNCTVDWIFSDPIVTRSDIGIRVKSQGAPVAAVNVRLADSCSFLMPVPGLTSGGISFRACGYIGIGIGHVPHSAVPDPDLNLNVANRRGPTPPRCTRQRCGRRASSLRTLSRKREGVGGRALRDRGLFRHG